MPEYRFKLTGWPALVVAALVLSISAYQLASRFQRIDESQRDALKAWLSKDYQGRGPRDLAKMVLDYQAGRPVEPPPEERPMDIDFVSLSAHGSRTNVVVRAQITVDGAPPLKGTAVRYFLLSKRSDLANLALGGSKDAGGAWSVVGESPALSYYTALLRPEQVNRYRYNYGQ